MGNPCDQPPVWRGMIPLPPGPRPPLYGPMPPQYGVWVNGAPDRFWQTWAGVSAPIQAGYGVMDHFARRPDATPPGAMSGWRPFNWANALGYTVKQGIINPIVNLIKNPLALAGAGALVLTGLALPPVGALMGLVLGTGGILWGAGQLLTHGLQAVTLTQQANRALDAPTHNALISQAELAAGGAGAGVLNMALGRWAVNPFLNGWRVGGVLYKPALLDSAGNLNAVTHWWQPLKGLLGGQLRFVPNTAQAVVPPEAVPSFWQLVRGAFKPPQAAAAAEEVAHARAMLNLSPTANLAEMAQAVTRQQASGAMSPETARVAMLRLIDSVDEPGMATLLGQTGSRAELAAAAAQRAGTPDTTMATATTPALELEKLGLLRLQDRLAQPVPNLFAQAGNAIRAGQPLTATGMGLTTPTAALGLKTASNLQLPATIGTIMPGAYAPTGSSPYGWVNNWSPVGMAPYAPTALGPGLDYTDAPQYYRF